jgi:hypothetical protein
MSPGSNIICARCGKDTGEPVPPGVDASQKVDIGSFCVDCTKIIDEMKKVVAEGGIYWECKDCKNKGVIKGSSELAKIIRKSTKIDPPAPCGIQFTKEEMCPVCGPNKEIYSGEAPPAQEEKGPEGT